MPQPALMPVAQYLRMSTEDQQYSFANQRDAMLCYAKKHDLVIVKSYEDAARSGLVLRYRKGLSRLLHDVVSGPVAFKAVLVYDVSRWGRFQDADEAAHYEYLCKHAGVPIHYCAEQFSNDGTVSSSLLKALKRTMAGEYSRELSVKSYAGQKRTASSGFRTGGTPGYGFRRLAITAEGRVRRKLTAGERKGFPSDRILLVPGPKAEIEQVRDIYKRFLRENGRIGPAHIARDLNRNGIAGPYCKPWSNATVRELLSNPKYVGTLIWGKTTQTLHTPVTPTQKNSWITRKNAYAAIIDGRTFARAQVLLLQRRADQKVPEEELLRSLRRILSRRGRICQNYMGNKKGEYGMCTYRRHFGGLQRAYDLVGFEYPPSVFVRRANAEATEQVRNSIIRNILDLFPAELVAFRLPNATRRCSLLLDGKFKLFVWVALSRDLGSGKVRWRLQPPAKENDGLTLLVTLRPGNEDYSGLYLFPALQMKCMQYTFGPDDLLLQKGVNIRDLSQLCVVAREVLVANAVPVPKLDLEELRESRLTLHDRPRNKRYRQDKYR